MYVPIKLDKTRNLRYGMRALALIEREMGVKISQVNYENLGMNDLITLVWAGLVHEQKELSKDEVIDLIDDYSNVKLVMSAVMEAMSQSFNLDDTSNEGDSSKNK